MTQTKPGKTKLPTKAKPPKITQLKRPTVTPWRYAVTVASGRLLGLSLSVIDGCISYRGLRDIGIAPFESGCLAMFIGVLQASVALALTSGYDIGAGFQVRFFSDSGLMGDFKRWLGCGILSVVAAFYIVDIWSNYVAFNPEASVGLLGQVLAIAAAVAFSLGDEMLQLFADENAIGQRMNATAFASIANDADLYLRYEAARLREGTKAARKSGQADGKRWRPRNRTAT